MVNTTLKNDQRPQVTHEQLMKTLRNMGVKFEQTSKPFSKDDNKHTSIMGKYNKRIVIK